MEKMLKKVFDYQRFSPSKSLGTMITETQRRYFALNEEELFLVSAAGNPEIMNDFPENKDGQRDRNI